MPFFVVVKSYDLKKWTPTWWGAPDNTVPIETVKLTLAQAKGGLAGAKEHCPTVHYRLQRLED